ncbi:TonB-dependent receptor [Microbulbifer taiwanensis]|uniref:TonB-dependent receptor n=1 Tax=Microbulbifer taiwanensis TaxID=986746 RepID=A0ABW1YN56_9GAMM|nr:TonB-dependent receptor [Microbulbifer taiwanensis]
MKMKTLAFAISAALAAAAQAADESLEAAELAVQDGGAVGESEGDTLEEVQVTGILNSIKSAEQIKRQSDNIVDAIVSTDIGKFPDENVAEALQRVPGVSVNRNNGEGQTVTVRGLGGNYNVTTFNGRKLASDNETRDFNYDIIASELINGVTVNKTPQAHLVDGGIGAVIDVTTARPLDIGEFSLAASFRGAYGERTESVDPRASLVVSNTFNDDTLGVLASLAHSSYSNRHDNYFGTGPVARDIDIGNDGSVDIADAVFPSYAGFTLYEDSRERTGGTFAVQWRPSDDIDINFDSLFSKYNIDSHGSQISIPTYSEWWLSAPNGAYTQATVDENNVVQKLAWDSPFLIDLIDIRNPRQSTTYQLGLAVDWDIDDFTFNADISHSRAKNENAGDNRFVVARTGVTAGAFDWGSGNKVPDLVLSDDITPDGTYGGWYSRLDGTGVEDEVSTFVLNGKWHSDGLFTEVLFGLGYTDQGKTRSYFHSTNASIFAADYLDEVLQNVDPSHLVDFYGHLWWELPSEAFQAGDADNFLDGVSGDFPQRWASVDMNKLFSFFEQLDPESAQLLTPVFQPESSYEIREEIAHAYIEGNMEGDLFDMPYYLNMGLRYAQTTTFASGHTQDIDRLQLDASGNPINDDWRHVQPVTNENVYSDLLPSLNFKLSLTDELIVRLAASQVIARPSLYELAPRTSINPVTGANGLKSLSISAGDLEPYTADQFDTALEWYYSDYGTLTFATFYKDVASFIKWEQSITTIDGFDFDTWKPVNQDEKSKIRGVELAWLQTFDPFLPEYLSGFGVQANYTYSDSVSGEKDEDGNNKDFAGMSKDQYNIVAFYEKDRLQARLAYNYRGDYFAGEVWGGSRFVNAFSWMDVSASYRVNDQFTLTAEVTNLQDKLYSSWVYSPSVADNAANYGRRFTVGVRANF